LLQASVQWNPSCFAVFSDADMKRSLLEIHVVPKNKPGLDRKEEEASDFRHY
jgi:hypothetical protein